MVDADDQTGLCGLKEIAEHIGKSEGTLRRLIAREHFPAVKIGGEWTSDAVMIRQWRRERIRGRRRREVKD